MFNFTDLVLYEARKKKKSHDLLKTPEPLGARPDVGILSTVEEVIQDTEPC